MTETLAMLRKASSPPGVTRQPSIRTLEFWIREALGFILDIAEVKGYLKVRPKDLEVYFGIHDRGVLTRFGKALVLIERAGLAVRWNRNRPARYSLVPKELWKRYVEVCSGVRFRCESDGSICGLVGVCPYWRVIEYVRWCYGNGGRC